MGSAKLRTCFSKWTTNSKLQTLFPFDCLGNTLRRPEPHPRRRDNGAQCWRGHRVTPPELAGHFVCPLCLTLFRHTGASKKSRIREDPQLFGLKGAFTAIPNQQSSSRWVSKSELGHTHSDSDAASENVRPPVWCAQREFPAQRHAQFRRFHEVKRRLVSGQSFVVW